MGIDRKAICNSYENAIFIDAGSAITVDVVKNSIYQGGFILLGLKKYKESYKKISEALNILNLKNISQNNKLPTSTQESINYGIVQSIKLIVQDISIKYPNMQIYVTGGDGKFITSLFKKSIFDELLIIKGVNRSNRSNKYIV